ncbi:hypothetical protein U27_01319 [Candidatus Vecturithrix granuli]|uniref:Uncharacterized protein n=1 Tax=Vecturithrix granuli TaxID=1499967 RepID=A0A081CA14_VECG1|nr:hypothetical protein U27_01319 [Candidatus Vecturithrix granuli]
MVAEAPAASDVVISPVRSPVTRATKSVALLPPFAPRGLLMVTVTVPLPHSSRTTAEALLICKSGMSFEFVALRLLYKLHPVPSFVQALASKGQLTRSGGQPYWVATVNIRSPLSQSGIAGGV